MEMRGTSRNLGENIRPKCKLFQDTSCFKSLTLYFQQVLLLTEIKSVSAILKTRNIKTIFEEVKHVDRIKFDETVLKAFGNF